LPRKVVIPSNPLSIVPGVGDEATLGVGAALDPEGDPCRAADDVRDAAAGPGSGVCDAPARQAMATTKASASVATTAPNGICDGAGGRPRRSAITSRRGRSRAQAFNHGCLG
jgi:hypothetical protein